MRSSGRICESGTTREESLAQSSTVVPSSTQAVFSIAASGVRTVVTKLTVTVSPTASVGKLREQVEPASGLGEQLQPRVLELRSKRAPVGTGSSIRRALLAVAVLLVTARV